MRCANQFGWSYLRRRGKKLRQLSPNRAVEASSGMVKTVKFTVGNWLYEYAVGSSDRDASSGADAITVGVMDYLGSRYSTVSYRSNPAAGDVSFVVETLSDLAAWSDSSGEMEEIGQQSDSDGKVTRVLRMSTPMENEVAWYYRIRIDLLVE